MADFIQTLCELQLQSSQNVPEWVHLIPNGKIAARDGRSFNLAEPETVVGIFVAGGIDLPIDYEHQNERPAAKLNGPVPAAGWIKELDAREDGLWGRVAWTERAKDLIGSKEYRFLSPSLLFDQSNGNILKLKGAGLVHNPALHLTALASQEDTLETETPLIKRLATALNMPAETDANSLLAAIESLANSTGEPDPNKYVPIAALQDLLRDRNKKVANLHESQVAAKVESAYQKGYLTPAMREWATALCSQDSASFDAFIAKSAPHFANFDKPVLPDGPPPESFPRQSSLADAVCGQLGLKVGRLKE